MTSDNTEIPKHVGIIMDGNGRWAAAQGMDRIHGHREGARVVEDISEACREMGVQYLTLYAFSTENWSRPQSEVTALMSLLIEFLESKSEKMIRNGIRLGMIGDISDLPENVQEKLRSTIHKTSGGEEMQLTLALNYGSRQEIIRAVKKMMTSQPSVLSEEVDESLFSTHLDTSGMPDPDIIIRTSGEHRVSNFMLWQAAYAEYFFVKPCWPDFNRETLTQVLEEFGQRERRFGKTSEQL
jgi:undecaprenyl diphosphate synthase